MIVALQAGHGEFEDRPTAHLAACGMSMQPTVSCISIPLVSVRTYFLYLPTHFWYLYAHTL